MWLVTLLPAFLIGAALGSFLNVLIDRLSTGRGFVTGRSYCEYCKKTLKTKDLIPLISYIVLLGKCRFCKKNIPLRLFIVELIVAVIASSCFYFAFLGLILPLQALFIFLVLYSFFGIFMADVVYGIIPDLMVILSLLGTIGYLFASSSSILPHLLSAIGCIAFFLFLFAITKGRGMGFGDVKLSFVLGLLLGFPLIVVSLYIAFLTGAIVAIILVICRKVRFFGGTIPFGPFLILSTVVSFFYGNEILSMFLTRFF